MAGLCKYSGAFGAPGKGAHKYRVGGLAAADLFATGGAAFLITRYAFGQKGLWAHVFVFIVLALVAVASHEAFCVNTRLNAALFGRAWPDAPVNID
jgi:hypothetical protein